MHHAMHRRTSLRSEDQCHLCRLAAIFHMWSAAASLASLAVISQSSVTCAATRSLNLLRAAYMLAMVVLQPGLPHADSFGIDIDRLCRSIPGHELSRDELFALAERESRRPGCQFGVLLRLMREDRVLGVHWLEETMEAEEGESQA